MIKIEKYSDKQASVYDGDKFRGSIIKEVGGEVVYHGYIEDVRLRYTLGQKELDAQSTQLEIERIIEKESI